MRGRSVRLLFVFIAMSLRTFAWGPEGHKVIADIALKHLTPPALQRIRELLGNDDLAAISMWADEIKQERPETFAWHFVDIPWNANEFNEQRDCERPRQGMTGHADCVVDRIELFKRVLGDRNGSQAVRVEALKFLVHFVADIHQPLHAIARDHGGTRTQVTQFGLAICGIRACNLHLTWDFGLIEHRYLAERAYAERIERLIQDEKLEELPTESPEEWANASFRLAHQVWLQDGGFIDEEYYERNINIVDHQLALAGLRLAAILNQTFTDESVRP